MPKVRHFYKLDKTADGGNLAGQTMMGVFSRRRMSRLTFLRVFCLRTSLSDLKLMGVFTSKIIFHSSNLRRSRARINQFE